MHILNFDMNEPHQNINKNQNLVQSANKPSI